MRVLKRLAVAVVLIVVLGGLAFGYALVQAIQAGAWLDSEIAALSKNWDAKILAREWASSMSPGELANLQAGFEPMRQGHLRSITSAACTFGPHLEVGGDDSGLRSECVVWATFDEGVVRFDVELSGRSSKWQIRDFEAQSDDQSNQDADNGI